MREKIARMEGSMAKRAQTRFKIYRIMILFLLLFVFVILSIVRRSQPVTSIAKEDAASLLSFVMYSEEEWLAFMDSDSDDVTAGDKEKIVEELGMENLTEDDSKNMKKTLSIEDWFSFYDEIVSVYDTEGVIQTKNLALVGSNENSDSIEGGAVYTNEGLFTWDESMIQTNLYHTITVICNQNQILYKKSEYQDSISLRNVWFNSQSEEGFQIFVDQYYINFDKPLEDDISNEVGDITFQDSQIAEVGLKADKISGKILSIQDDSIEIEGYGNVPLDDYFRIYTVYGTLEQQTIKELLVGYNVTEFVVAEGKLCAGLVTQTLTMDYIRVLIKSNDYEDIFHNEVTFTATTDYTISYGEDQETHTAGEEVTIQADSSYWKENRIKIEPVTLSGEVVLTSVQRALGTPSYRGTMEIVKSDSGMVLINEVLLEEYLYAVVPSEMPESYGMEALKAQAICARSYAYNQVLSVGYPEYGAHVDDSVSYQVYNNQEESDTCTQAVKETNGQVAMYQGSVINAYYFSTSCGHTTDCTVWANTDNGMAYLQGSYVGEADSDLDLTKEEDFTAFITNIDYDAYEKNESWYRWNTMISVEDLSDSLNTSLAKVSEANPDLVLVKEDSGNYVSKTIETIGKIKNISVVKRNAGGVAREVVVEGKKATIKIITENKIRSLLAPVNADIIKQDGSVTNGSSMLPSAYFIVSSVTESDKVTGFQFIGGGYGHGAGMSQNGAKDMASIGKNCEEILKFFYTDITLQSMYE